VRVRGDFIDDNLNPLTWWTNKHNAYASREAVDLLNQKYGFSGRLAGGFLSREARYKRWLKKTYTHTCRWVCALLPTSFTGWSFSLAFSTGASASLSISSKAFGIATSWT